MTGRALLMLCITILAASTFALAQSSDCRFLNEDCAPEGRAGKIPKGKGPPERSVSEHLSRCLAYYVRINGPFVPKGKSTKQLKSESDMTAMCNIAIQQKNYYWDHPVNSDAETNLKCCMRYYRDDKACKDNLAVPQPVDFCQILQQWGDPSDSPDAKPQWSKPGCTMLRTQAACASARKSLAALRNAGFSVNYSADTRKIYDQYQICCR